MPNGSGPAPSIGAVPASLTTLLRAASAVAVVLALASCSTGVGQPVGAAATTADLTPCPPAALRTVVPGKLTLSTAAVTRSPWVVGGDARTSGNPKDGKGYDAAVGYAVADRLGFAAGQVTWKATPFATALAPGSKDFDVNVNQATINDQRRASVDLSSPYYVVRQAVVSLTGRPAAAARTLADLRGARFAVVKGSPGQRALADAGLAATTTAYPGLDQVRGAVSDSAQDALVVDLPTALELDRDDTRLVDGKLVGLLPRDELAEKFGLVLQKGSSLTPCVDAALASLRQDGTLDRLEREWLVDRLAIADLR